MQPHPLPLRDIHLPEAIGWWPPAPGWWLVALLVPLLLALSIWLYKRLTRQTAIKTAKKLLAGIRNDTTGDTATKLRELSMLIRRVAISTNPRTKSASLTGRNWLAFLDAPLKGAPFSEGVGRYLADGPYRNLPPDGVELARLINLCEEWLKTQAKQR